MYHPPNKIKYRRSLTTDMVEDKKISESAELLLKGAKMLRYHCPDCLLPLFKDNEKIFCPSCKREFIIEGEEAKTKAQPETEREVESKETKAEIGGDLTRLVECLMENLIKKAMSSESLYEIREIVEIVERLARILERLKCS